MRWDEAFMNITSRWEWEKQQQQKQQKIHSSTTIFVCVFNSHILSNPPEEIGIQCEDVWS